MAEIASIGFIGIGNMGWPMAANLARSGYAVTVFDLNAKQAEKFASEFSAKSTASLAELGRSSDAVITMLPSGKEVRSVLFDAEGGALAANLKSGGIVIDMSSSDPVGTRDTGALLAKRGVAFIDAPVSGGIPRATDATLSIMIGGDPKAVEHVKPVLSKMGKNLFDVGSLGCGHAAKALNNYLTAVSFAATSEAVLIGQQFGLDPQVLIDVVNVSSGRNFSSEAIFKPMVLDRKFATGFALSLLAKDVKIASDLADAVNTEAPMMRLIRDLWGEARDKLGPAEDFTGAFKHWEQRRFKSAAE